jgi:hypothetical protein
LTPIVTRAAPRIHVHATSRIEVRASRKDGKIYFWGRLLDDTGHFLTKRALKTNISEESPQGAVVLTEPCGNSLQDFAWTGHGSISTVTDASGTFCVAANSASPSSYFAHFQWEGDANVDGASFDLKVDPSRRALELRFEPSPTVINLDEPSFELRATALINDGDAPDRLGAIQLDLTDERGTPLGHQAVNEEHSATFTVARAQLGGPGPGEIRLLFAGNASISPAALVVPVERRASVILTVPELGPEGTLRPADPEEGVSISVAVTTQAGARVPTGVVEASVFGHAVGSAPVEKGHADLVVLFSPADSAKTTDLRIRYASDAPWYLGGDEITAPLPIRAGRPWRKALLLLASLGVVVWLVLARRRPVEKVAKPKPDRDRPLPTGKPGIQVVRASPDARLGWSGLVSDAHDGLPLVDVEVRLERPSFTAVEVLARTTTGTSGRFELRYEAAKKGDRLVIDARFHGRVERSSPPFGEIEVALTARRRLILERLVSWAKASGGAYRGPREPTPGQVARADQDPKAQKWARRVEEASFGPTPVDAQAEAEVERIAPDRR